jgi:hypothetical protein
VLLVVGLALLLGGGRRLLQVLRARRAVNRLEEGTATPAEIEAAAGHGRAAIPELLRLLDPRHDETTRTAAGRALLRLWAADELIAEEEKGVATRLFEVQWLARRRYPRQIRGALRFEVRFGLTGLDRAGQGIRPDQLEWSWRIRGAPRASLEQFSAWQVVEQPIHFQIEAADLPAGSDMALAFQARVRTRGLTSRWELELPQVPFRFERDEALRVESILAPADSIVEEAMSRVVRFEISESRLGQADVDPVFVPIDPEFAIVGQPRIGLDELTCDLAHRAILEFAEPKRSVGAGEVVYLAARGEASTSVRPLQVEPAPEPLVAEPGAYRIRLVLTPDPDLGWAHPDVRSVWPRRIVTEWQEARVVRR